MADKEHVSESSSKHFFTTLPGIITAIAGLITAIGGFLLILNKTGCISSKTASETAIEKPVSEDDPLKRPQIDNSTSETNSTSFTISYSPAEIKVIVKNVVFKINSANIQRLPNNEIVLNVKLKCVNDSKYEYHFYSDNMRVTINDDKYASESSSPSGDYESVAANSFKNLEYNYRLPSSTKKFNLTVYDEKQEMGSSAFTILK